MIPVDDPQVRPLSTISGGPASVADLVEDCRELGLVERG
jgi:hypothetical protein